MLAIPFMVLREVDLDVALPETLRRLIDQVDLGRNEKLFAGFQTNQLTAFGGFLYIDSADAGERQDVHVGNLVFAGEHLSDAFSGFMNGAAETGRLAANVVLRRMRETERPLPEAAE
jgi:monoamine oxidase